MVLSLTEDTEWLANEYIRYGAVPKRYAEDAIGEILELVRFLKFFCCKTEGSH